MYCIRVKMLILAQDSRLHQYVVRLIIGRRNLFARTKMLLFLLIILTIMFLMNYLFLSLIHILKNGLISYLMLVLEMMQAVLM